MTTLAPFCDNEDSEDVINDEDEHYDISNMSDFASDVITYVAGSVTHYLIKKIKCETCVYALMESDSFNKNAQFINLKDILLQTQTGLEIKMTGRV
ncbi:unnamed protein product [Euphydryas editha]|uniref:Uncharacterized protein n=1 Tax=Euphydryas editha TaxID=104508 RepID=A0AAU9TN37_EUPED|nr:unnamed protein product [Euphydryas editha]